MLARLLGLGSKAPGDVFFARDILHNELRRWSLIVKGRRYELVRTAEGDYVFLCNYDPDWTEARERARVDSMRPPGYRAPSDGWVMVHIGWSSLPKKEIDWCFANARAHYPLRLSWSQCQDFLRRFADLFVDRHTLQWRFLMDNTNLEQRSVAQLPPLSVAIVLQGQAKAAEQQGQAQAAEQQRDAFMRRIPILNAMGASMVHSENQNLALNQQIQQNNNGGINCGGN